MRTLDVLALALAFFLAALVLAAFFLAILSVGNGSQSYILLR
jgi:hypothetical protein